VTVYDPESKKLIVRVVYDGPGMAGKTTNLQQIHATFGPDRRSELYSGTTAAARTLYLDWMQLDGGLVRGHDLRCHLLTVPGQAALNRRRQLLLSMADSVVFVVDSSEEGVLEALPMWRSLQACTGGLTAGVPVLIQANKQDRPGALTVAELRERWNLDPAIPIVPANAASGHGVRETVVLAIRGAAVLLQGDLTKSSLAELEGSYESGREIERRMIAAEGAHLPAALDAHPVTPSTIPSVGTAASVESDAPQPSMRDSRKGERGGKRGVLTPDAPAPAASDSIARFSSAAAPGALEPTPPAPIVDAGEVSLALPTADVPRGFVWPAVEGRNTLRRVPLLEAVRRPLARSRGPRGRASPSQAILFEAGNWCLKTSRRRRFSSPDEARKELSRLAHNKLELGALCVPRTILVAQHDPDKRYSVWTVSLWQPTFTSQLEQAAKNEDESALSEVLSHYARVVVRSLRVCLDSNRVLDLDPRNFGLFCDEVFYFDDELPYGVEMPLAGHAMLRRFDEYAAHPGALGVYLEVLLQELERHLRVGEAEQLNLHHSIAKTIVGTDASKRAKNRLSSALEARRGVSR
jgi:signal recognition particle receptor subunit beta